MSSATQDAYANDPASLYICDSLDSECIHPDPSYYEENGCEGDFNVTYEACCSSGGEDPQEAQGNDLNCTVTLGNSSYNIADCPTYNQYVVNADTGIQVIYYPCDRYTGNVILKCSAYRAADDNSGDGPGSLVTTGTFTIKYNPLPCTTCTGGTCDPVMGCICPEGRSGEDCQYTIEYDNAASTASTGFALLLSAGLAVMLWRGL